MAGQVAHQPFYARVEVPPGDIITFKFLINTLRVEHIAGAIFRTFACAHNAGDFNSRLILRRQRQLNGVQLAFRKPFTPLRVLRNSTRRAVAIHQHRNQFLTGALASSLSLFAACKNGLYPACLIISPSMFSSSLLSLLPASSMATASATGR